MNPSTALSSPATSICELLLEQSPGCTWALNRGHEFHLVFGDVNGFFGRTAEQLPGIPFTEVFAPEARRVWTSRVERVFSGEAVCAAARPCDSGFTSSIALFPVRGPGGDIALAGGRAQRVSDRDLMVRILRAQDADRQRLSKLLHDHVGQCLSAAGLQLDLLRMDLAGGAFPIAQRTAEIQGILEAVMELVRDINHELNPAFAERMGLRAALDRLAGRLRSDFKGTVRVSVDPGAGPPAQAAASLYRIAQEAAWNAVRHSGCSVIEILLKSVRSGPALEVRDNGSGFDLAESVCRSRGLGLLVMEECAEQAAIGLDIESAPGKGTVVRAMCGPPTDRNTG